jgi:hypothetical protein
VVPFSSSSNQPKKPEKWRPVFDASAYYKGTSLNSTLLKVPDLLTNLIAVLLRFRHHPVGLSANIFKMFHEVKVRRQDGPALRFFYRDPGSLEPPAVYQMDVSTILFVHRLFVLMFSERQLKTVVPMQMT